jgi:hypothetical protein
MLMLAILVYTDVPRSSLVAGFCARAARSESVYTVSVECTV